MVKDYRINIETEAQLIDMLENDYLSQADFFSEKDVNIYNACMNTYYKLNNILENSACGVLKYQLFMGNLSVKLNGKVIGYFPGDRFKFSFLVCCA